MSSAPEDNDALRRSLINTARQLTVFDLARNTSGNVSQRVEGGFLITPTGMQYDRLEPDDIVRMDFDGGVFGRRLPSSEWRFHRDILAERPEVNVVLHGHPPFSTSIACLREGIPAFHYMVAKGGGPDIRCAPYATFGTAELSAHAVDALRGRKACLLANHGLIAIGADLAAALTLAIEIETVAEMYWRARQIGTPILLDAAEMDRVVEKFRTYGQQPGV